MPTPIELLIKAKRDTDDAFKGVLKQLQDTGSEAKKSNDLLKKLGDEGLGKLNGIAGDLSGKLGGVGSAIAGLGPVGLAAAASIGLIVAAATAVTKVTVDSTLAAAAYGDKIVDLSNKTDLSTKSLQAFDVMARTGNTSVEAVAAAALKMGRNIVGGSDAFKRLGLDLEQLKTMSPEEQFKAVAVAIEGLGSNAERSAARVAIFGKSGDELTSVLHEAATGATELGGALSDEALQASADLNDKIDLLKTAMERVVLQFGAAIAKSPELAKALEDITDVIVQGAEKIGEWAPAITKAFDVGVLEARKAMAAMVAATRSGLVGGYQAWQEYKQKVEQLELDALFSDVKSGHSSNQQKKTYGPSDADQKAAAAAAKRLADEQLRQEERMQAAMRLIRQKAVEQLEADGKKRLADSLAVLQNILQIEEANEAQREQLENERIADEQRKGDQIAANRKRRALEEIEHWQAIGKSIDDVSSILDAMGGVLDALGISSDSTIGKMLTGFQSLAGAAQHGVQAFAAFSSGNIIGGITSGLGAVSGLISGVKSVFGALFGGSNKALEEARKMRTEFVNSMGGIDALKKAADRAGISLQSLLTSKSASAIRGHIADIKADLEDWDNAQKILTEGMQKYGLSAAAMGAGFASLELDKRTKEIALFFAGAQTIGADMGAVTAGMAKDVKDLVAQYQAAGLEIPAALRPVLEAMLKNGQLTKENGEAYGSLEEAGIKFGQTTSEALSTLATEMRKLMEVLARGFHIPITYDVSGSPEPPGAGGGAGGGHPPREEEVPEFAYGAVVSGRTQAVVGEGGPEAILPLDDSTLGRLGQAISQAMAGMGGGGRSATPVVYNRVSIGGRDVYDEMSQAHRRGQIQTHRNDRSRGSNW